MYKTNQELTKENTRLKLKIQRLEAAIKGEPVAWMDRVKAAWKAFWNPRKEQVL